MSDLIARLEAAPCGSRELSDEVLEALGWLKFTAGGWTYLQAPDGRQYHREPQGAYEPPPDPTRSVDDALALVPEGWSLYRIDQYHDGPNPAWGWGVHLRCHANPSVGMAIGESRGSLCLALDIAILRAREASDAR